MSYCRTQSLHMSLRSKELIVRCREYDLVLTVELFTLSTAYRRLSQTKKYDRDAR
jgi:hypothetical protein